VEQSLIVVSRTVHCLTRTVSIALEGNMHLFLPFILLYFILLYDFALEPSDTV
jgi:hypothetical protein